MIWWRLLPATPSIPCIQCRGPRHSLPALAALRGGSSSHPPPFGHLVRVGFRSDCRPPLSDACHHSRSLSPHPGGCCTVPWMLTPASASEWTPLVLSPLGRRCLIARPPYRPPALVMLRRALVSVWLDACDMRSFPDLNTPAHVSGVHLQPPVRRVGSLRHMRSRSTVVPICLLEVGPAGSRLLQLAGQTRGAETGPIPLLQRLSTRT